MINKLLIYIPITALFFGCSFAIDDFQIIDEKTSDDTETSDADSDMDSDSDSDSDLDSDSDTDSEIQCGIMIDMPDGDSIEFCSSKGAIFKMGCDEKFSGEACLKNELPQREVEVSPFIIQRFEATSKQYAAFVKAHPEWAKDGAEAKNCTSNYLSNWSGGVPAPALYQRPVIWVCWYAADAFCEWLSGSLPTEAQWELAARVSATGKGVDDYWIYPFEGSPNCTFANYEGCKGDTMDVGTTTGMSRMGLYDMGGNVSEWVSDWHRENYYCDPEGVGGYILGSCDEKYVWKDPEGDSSGKLKGVRGGSWYHSEDMMRAAKRYGINPSTAGNLIGFRCAR